MALPPNIMTANISGYYTVVPSLDPRPCLESRLGSTVLLVYREKISKQLDRLGSHELAGKPKYALRNHSAI